MALRIEAEGWLSAAGIDQWQDPNTRGNALEKWRADIENGRTWVVERKNEVVATVTLAAPDLDFWRTEDDLDSALYVAKLITSRKAAGENLGGRIIDWVCQRAISQQKEKVRLDVWRDNAALQSYYQRQGFTHVRTECPTHRRSGWLGERNARHIRFPTAPLRAIATA
ncbi:GNAT family N-acetyltransferase [Streptomyces chumphonensis]|uniref:GNAT family N-acetyltransferase n=1 Tax=Streptomyces chumphonensis TaxID=1214925 RepID=UPI003D727C28